MNKPGLHILAFVAPVLVYCIFALCSCAVAPVEVNQQDFIAERELDAVTIARRGLVYFEKSRFVDAELAFRQALYIRPDADNLRFNLALALEQQGQYEQAEQILKALIEKKPEAIVYINALGHLYNSAYRFEEATRQYKKSLELAYDREVGPQAAEILRSLATIAFRIGDEDSAICYSEEALKAQKSPIQLRRHVKLLIARTESDRGIKAIEGHRKEGGSGAGNSDPELTHLLALAYFDLGELEKSKELLEPIKTKANVDPLILSDIVLLDFIYSRNNLNEGAEDEDYEVEDEEEVPQLLLAELPTEKSLYWPITLLDTVTELQDEFLELE